MAAPQGVKPDLSDLKRRLGIADGPPKVKPRPKPTEDVESAVKVAVEYGRIHYDHANLKAETLVAARSLIELAVADALLEDDYEDAILKIQAIVEESKELDGVLEALEKAALQEFKERA
jgi:hypothetical protein